jgi:hypothetical protein
VFTGWPVTKSRVTYPKPIKPYSNVFDRHSYPHWLPFVPLFFFRSKSEFEFTLCPFHGSVLTTSSPTLNFLLIVFEYRTHVSFPFPPHRDAYSSWKTRFSIASFVSPTRLISRLFSMREIVHLQTGQVRLFLLSKPLFIPLPPLASFHNSVVIKSVRIGS